MRKYIVYTENKLDEYRTTDWFVIALLQEAWLGLRSWWRLKPSRIVRFNAHITNAVLDSNYSTDTKRTPEELIRVNDRVLRWIDEKKKDLK